MNKNIIFVVAVLFVIEAIVAWRCPKIFRYNQDMTIGICLILAIMFFIVGVVV